MNNDRITELYEGAIGPLPSQRRARARIHWLATHARGDRVLDVGCSQGIASILLAREGREVVGIDMEQPALEFARARLEQEEPHVAERLTFEWAEASKLPYEDESFDTVLLGEILEHQLDPAPVVREARRVLRGGGALVLTTPYGIFRYHDHKEPLYLRSVLDLLEGYTVERVEVMDKWLGVVARAAAEGEPRLTPEAWSMALEAAEKRLMELDAGLEDRSETLKSVQSKLAEARQERDNLKDADRRATESESAKAALEGAREQLVSLRAQRGALTQQLESAVARAKEAEQREREAHGAQLDAERRLAMAEGRIAAATAEVTRQSERADAVAGEVATAREQIAHLEAERGRRDAARIALEQEIASLERQIVLADERVIASQSEADLGRERIERLEEQHLEAERRQEAHTARAAELERRVATLEVERDAALERAEALGRELEEERERSETQRRTMLATAQRPRSAPEPPAPPAAGSNAPSVRAVPPPRRTAPGPEPAAASSQRRADRGATAVAAAPERPRSLALVSPPAPTPEGRAKAKELGKSGRQHFQAGDYQAAARDLRQAAEGDGKGEHWFWLARAHRNLKQHEPALDAALRALETRPGWRDALWVALGSASRLTRTAVFEELTAELGPLEKIPTKDLERLAPLALRAGAHQLAADIADRLVGKNRQSRPGLEVRAAARWELGDESRALEDIDEAVAGGDPVAIRAALTICRHIDRFERVPELLAALDPPEPDLIIGFAQTFVKVGDAQPALELLDRAALLRPDDERIGGLRRQAEEQRRLHDGSWAPPRVSRSVDPVPGRVLHLVARSVPHHTSGGTYRNHYIAKAQRDAGLDPYLVTEIGFPWNVGRVDAPHEEEVDGIPYLRLVDEAPDDPAVDARLRRALEQLIPLVESLRPAVLHPASDYLNALVGLELGAIFGLPVVYEVRGFPEVRLVRRPGSRVMQDPFVGRRALELKCMAAADRIVTLAEVMRRHMGQLGIDEGKIHIVPNGVDPAALQPVQRDPDRARALGIPEGATVLGYVSTFHGYEGIHFIIEATAELRRRGREVRALLVGDGRERAFLERRARELGIEEAVIFTGRVPHDDVLAYYGLIDIFVVPRRDEATSELVTPLKPFEAMGVARTVVASDLSALREIVEDRVTGRLFRPEDAIHLADVAEELIEDPAERMRLAENGYRWVTTERTWGRNGSRYVELYSELGVF